MTFAIWAWMWVGMNGSIDLPFHLTVIVNRDKNDKIISCESESITLEKAVCDERTHLTVAPPSSDGYRVALKDLELKCEPQKKGAKLWIKCKTD